MFVGSAEEAFQRTIDEPRISLGQIIVTETGPVHGAWREIYQDDVCTGGEPIKQCASFDAFEIDGEAALVAVEGGEEAGPETDEAAGRIAIGRLDLDHVGAEIGQDQACARSHNGVTELE